MLSRRLESDASKSHLEIGEEGLTLINFPKRRCFRWDAICRVDTEGPALVLTMEEGAKVSIYHAGYAYGSEIRGQIEERIRPFQKRVERGDYAPVEITEDKPLVQVVGRRS